MEDLNAAQMSSTFPDALPDAVKREMQFLLELQRVHDSAFYSEGRPFIDDISFGLRRFAREFRLDYSIVQRLLRESEVVHGTPSSDDAPVHSVT